MHNLVVGLLICFGSSVAQDAGSQTPRQRYDALIKEYEAEELAWNARYGAGQLNDPQAQIIARYRDWPGWSFAARFLEIADANPDDPAAGDALIWIVNLAPSVGVGDRQLVPTLGRAFHLLSLRTTDPGATDDEAERLLERSIREFGGVIFRRDARPGGPDVTVADAAHLEMAELRKPAVGRFAPQIEAKDVDGKLFKLSEFRGKIVHRVDECRCEVKSGRLERRIGIDVQVTEG